MAIAPNSLFPWRPPSAIGPRNPKESARRLIGNDGPRAEYDGSVIAERTNSELPAGCGGTSRNSVALNLAHDVISGRRTLAQARGDYSQLCQADQRGEKPPHTQSFRFALPRGDTVDRDQSTIEPSGTRH